MKQIHSIVINRKPREAFGFRIIGGKDEGLSFKVGKIVVGSPAEEAGLKVYDFLISVQGQEVFDLKHSQVVAMIRDAGNSVNLTIERGDHIVPNFEEIWPSGKSKAGKEQCNPSKGINYVMNAMSEGVPGVKNEVFTTVGKPKIECHQYDNPIMCYSEDAIKEMSERGTWKFGGLADGAQNPNQPHPAGSAAGAAKSSAVMSSALQNDHTKKVNPHAR